MIFRKIKAALNLYCNLALLPEIQRIGAETLSILTRGDPPKPSDSLTIEAPIGVKDFLTGPMTDEQIVGAYRMLAYMHPKTESVEWLLSLPYKKLLGGEGGLQTLLQLEEVKTTLFLPQLRETSLPMPIKLKSGDVVFGYAWDRFVSVPLALSGEYEPHVSAALERHVKPGATVLDIGANIGIHAAHMSRLVGASGSVIAFEAVPSIFELLSRTKEANALSQLTCLNVALSDVAGVVSMAISGVNLGGSAVALDAATIAESTTQVPAARLDDILVGKPDVSFIKADVEGHEAYVFKGGWETIKRCRPTIISEFCPANLTARGSHPAQLIDAFADLGYAIGVAGWPHVFTSGGELMSAMERNGVVMADVELTIPGR